MKITYDKDADAMYIKLLEGEFASNKVLDKDTILDLNKEGHILGIEILDVSKRMGKKFLSNIQVENLIPEDN